MEKLSFRYLHRWQPCCRRMKICIFDRYISIATICHIVRAVYLAVPLRLSVHMTQGGGMILRLSSRDLVFVSTARLYTTSIQVTSVWTASYGTWREEGGQVHESLERDHNGQANIWQLYTTTIVCQKNWSWRQQDDYLLGCLHSAESLARQSNTPTVVKQLNADQCQDRSRRRTKDISERKNMSEGRSCDINTVLLNFMAPFLEVNQLFEANQTSKFQLLPRFT